MSKRKSRHDEAREKDTATIKMLAGNVERLIREKETLMKIIGRMTVDRIANPVKRWPPKRPPCDGCSYFHMPNDGGWCYMFRPAPVDEYCLQFKPILNAVVRAP